MSMNEDPTERIDTGETHGETHAPAEPWDQASAACLDTQESNAAVVHLRDAARTQSKTWKISNRRGHTSVLEKRRQKAARSIPGLERKIGFAAAKTPDPHRQLFVNSQRLLRSASLDVRASLHGKWLVPLVRAGTDQPEEVPRAYLAAQA